MGSLMRLGFAEFNVPDLAQAHIFYESVLGLIKTAESDEKLYYKCWDEYDHHSVVHPALAFQFFTTGKPNK